MYLERGLRERAEVGKHPFIARIAGILQGAGYRVEYRPDSETERLKSATRRGYSLFHMKEPTHDRALTFRRVYHYPFWAIEPTGERWNWTVAHSVFPADSVPRKEADRFYRFWQKRLFGADTAQATRAGFIYVPLQGRLLDHRSFQTCAPLDMLRAVMAHFPDRSVVAALHPNETYCQAELQALQDLVDRNSGLDIRTGGMQSLLAGCDFTVTQNSAVAFSGFFYGKPAVLFGRSDFHHIAANVGTLGVSQALQAGDRMAPDYAGYIHWFWQKMSINAGHPSAEDKIRQAFLRAGWPM